MKNNRSLIVESDFLNKKNIPKTSPPEDSLFWQMWNTCKDIAEEALNTSFVQGIKNGTLDPTVYGAFNISDACYCFHGADDYSTVANRAEDPILKYFLTQKHNSYAKYNATFPTTWRILDYW